MEFTNTFTVPAGIDEAFATLTDLEKVTPCMPGAKLETVDGDTYTGRVKVKVGPMSLTYRGTAELLDVDPDAHTARIEARGNEARGGGTANADVTAALTEVADGTEVVVTTAIDVTGKPAQFGRGVMGDVGKKIIDTFAECLSKKFDEPEPATGADGADDDGQDASADDEAADSGDAADDDSMDGGITGIVPEASAATAPSGATAAQAGAASVQDGDAVMQSPSATASSSGPRTVSSTEPEVEALDLMEVAGDSVAKRVVPAVAGLGLVALVVWLVRRRST